MPTFQRDISQHCWRVWPPCCDVLGVVGQVWKWSDLSQQHPTCRNRVAKRAQNVMLKQCCDMLCCNVAIAWPGPYSRTYIGAFSVVFLLFQELVSWLECLQLLMIHVKSKYPLLAGLQSNNPGRQSKQQLFIVNGKHVFTQIFRLEILDYLSRRSVYLENFPLGRAKIVVPFTFWLKCPDVFGYRMNNRRLTRNE